MDRRSFLKTTGAVAGAAAVPAGASAMIAETGPVQAPARSTGAQSLRVACEGIANIPGVDLLVQQFGDTLNSISEGKLQLAAQDGDGAQFSAGGTDLLASGEADIVLSLALRPARQAFDAIGGHDLFAFQPFGFDAAQYQAWLSAGGGQLVWDATLAPCGIKPLPVASLQSSGSFWLNNAPGTSAGGLSGRRLFAPSLAGAALRLAGVSILEPSISDREGAFAGHITDGTMDGTIAQTALADHGHGLAQTGARRYASAFARAALPLAAAVQLSFWERLSASERDLIGLALLRAGQNFAAAHFAQERMVAALLDGNSGDAKSTASVARAMPAFSPAPDAQLFEATRDALAGFSAGDAAFRRVHDCQTGFRDFLSPQGEALSAGV